MDIENYIKPIFDGVAAGLFCEKDVDKFVSFKFDDSNFVNLYIERLPDAKIDSDEGVIITIAQKAKPNC